MYKTHSAIDNMGAEAISRIICVRTVDETDT